MEKKMAFDFFSVKKKKKKFLCKEINIIKRAKRSFVRLFVYLNEKLRDFFENGIQILNNRNE